VPIEERLMSGPVSAAWEHTRRLLDAWQSGQPLYLTRHVVGVGAAGDVYDPSSVAVSLNGTATFFSAGRTVGSDRLSTERPIKPGITPEEAFEAVRSGRQVWARLKPGPGWLRLGRLTLHRDLDDGELRLNGRPLSDLSLVRPPEGEAL